MERRQWRWRSIQGALSFSKQRDGRGVGKEAVPKTGPRLRGEPPVAPSQGVGSRADAVRQGLQKPLRLRRGVPPSSGTSERGRGRSRPSEKQVGPGPWGSPPDPCWGWLRPRSLEDRAPPAGSNRASPAAAPSRGKETEGATPLGP
ncbi:hypothetical protein NDU88_004497 [Pleurodeles waltl]|uniref:Uncharacterized protein n=1 Tax=Pleurodeles waltl TaxID=8319 RepID=A0AAV7WUG2_PLEWA|nr:hypothetical protein NDU88_004497 [Pleurodeles waltl]